MQKKFYAIVNKEEKQFVLEKSGEATARLVFAERDVVFDIVRVGPHEYSVLSDGRSYTIEIDRQKENVRAFWCGEFVDFKLLDEKAWRRIGSAAALDAGGGSGEVVSPMPGKVVKIQVQPGQSIKAGDGVIVVEAMKMENEFKSPKDGVVKDVRVKVGDSVEGGAVLVVVE